MIVPCCVWCSYCLLWLGSLDNFPKLDSLIIPYLSCNWIFIINEFTSTIKIKHIKEHARFKIWLKKIYLLVKQQPAIPLSTNAEGIKSSVFKQEEQKRNIKALYIIPSKQFFIYIVFFFFTRDFELTIFYPNSNISDPNSLELASKSNFNKWSFKLLLVM